MAVILKDLSSGPIRSRHWEVTLTIGLFKITFSCNFEGNARNLNCFGEVDSGSVVNLSWAAWEKNK